MRASGPPWPTIAPLLCALAALCVTLLVAPPFAVGTCVDPAPLRHGSQINVAVLVWIADEPEGLFRGNLTDTRATKLPFGNSLVQPWMMAVDMYVKRMRGRPLPLPDGQSVTLNFVYINLANTKIPPGIKFDVAPDFDHTAGQWNYSRLWHGVPQFIGASVLPIVPGSFLFPGLPEFGLPKGLAYKVISTDPAVLLENFGIDKPFTFIVPSAMFVDAAVVALANLVEDAQSHIIVHPLLSSPELFICDGIVPTDAATGAPSRTPDCLSPKYGRKRRGGARRFNTLFTTLSDASSNQLAALDSFHTLGVRSIVIVRDAVHSAFTLSLHAAKMTADAAAQLNIAVLEIVVLVKDVCPGSALCPAEVPDAQLFPGGQSAEQVAARIAGLNPDALVILGQPGSTASWSIGQLFLSLRRLPWSPRALSWGCGIEGGLDYFLPRGVGDLMYTWSTKSWDPELRGPSYQNFLTDTNFEMIPAVPASEGVAGRDGPAVFSTAFEAEYGESAPGGKHPMYFLSLKDNSTPAIGFATMILVQKMLEAAQSGDVGQIVSAAKSMAQPGMYGRVALDMYGRTARVNEVLQQLTPDGLVTLAPYNIGRPPIFPMPTWKEREFAPVQYGTAGEQAVVALTALCIALCAVLLALVLANHRAPVIRAASPSFCAVIILGAILMLASNFFSTLVVDDAQCAASTWLLTVGFTLTFAALFIKTFRIWRIFGDRKLQVLKMTDTELLLAVALFVLVDIVINATWAGTAGMHAVRVRVDPHRPAYDYWQCDYSDSMGAVVAHLVVKGGLLLCGVVLTYSVRGVPSQFNESTLIGLAIYNTAFVIAFIVPILAVGLGGRETTFQLRAYAIIFACSSCCGLLYIPKLLFLRRGARASAAANRAGTTDVAKTGGTASPFALQTPHYQLESIPAARGRARGIGGEAALSGTYSVSDEAPRRSSGNALSGGGIGAPSAYRTGAPDVHPYSSQLSSLGISIPVPPFGGGGGGAGTGAGTGAATDVGAAVSSVAEAGPLFVHTHSLQRASLGVPGSRPPARAAMQAQAQAQATFEARLVQPGAVDPADEEVAALASSGASGDATLSAPEQLCGADDVTQLPA